MRNFYLKPWSQLTFDQKCLIAARRKETESDPDVRSAVNYLNQLRRQHNQRVDKLLALRGIHRAI